MTPHPKRRRARAPEAAPHETEERAIIAAIEREQRRLGDTLHETLAQQLTGTALALKAVSNSLQKRGVPEAEKLERIAGMLNDGVTQAREIIHSLRPVEFDPEGLTLALRQLAARTGARRPCVFDCPSVVAIPDSAVALHLYRIAQEAVENAVKHGLPGEIVISSAPRRSAW